MASNSSDTGGRFDPASAPLGTEDSERPTDPDNDDSLPDHLDVGPEVPVPDVIDQRRLVVLDDDLDR